MRTGLHWRLFSWSGLSAPAFAQKAEIEAVNAKWMELFKKGDFAGIASLYTDDATALPPGAAMVKGSAAIAAMWKSLAAQVSDPKVTSLDVKPLGPSAAREIGTFSLKTKGPTPQEFPGNLSWCGGTSRPLETPDRGTAVRQVPGPAPRIVLAEPGTFGALSKLRGRISLIVVFTSLR